MNGLKLDAEGNVVIDQEFTKTLMGKSGLTFKPILPADNEDEEPVMLMLKLVEVYVALEILKMLREPLSD